uniref:GRAM domain-containing protein 2A-like isoform X2 n=1 Tax=Oncorhynchus gorbuscha TaxID=8017 RepID=UPI001EAEB4EA|nr:GRAM domain-containing protein 2A-like isoform X2 [Oncorhynchus gorbuscha]
MRYGTVVRSGGSSCPATTRARLPTAQGLMGCTIYAASPEALPGDEATGRDHRHHHRPHGPCNQKIPARPNTMTEHQEQNDEGVLISTQDLETSKHQDTQGGHPQFRLIDDLSYEDVKKCYRGSSVSCSGVRHAVDVCVCVCVRLCVRLQHAESGAAELSSSEREGGRRFAGGRRPAKELLMTLPCPSAQTVSKYNSQYHKLFQCVPKDEILMKVYSCALLRDILLQGRLYISRNWLCFYANLFGKDIKVAIPVVSVRLVKKHKTAGLVPNGLAITTDTSQKYVFVSLLSRDSVYDVLRRICTHLQVNGKSLSLKHYMEVPHTLSLDEFPVADEFPGADEYPPVLKWRRKPSVVSVSSSLPDLLGSSTGSLTAVDSSFQTDQPLEDRGSETEKILLTEPVPELGPMEYQLLKFFIILIILLILSSCYLAFRVCSLEHQLSFLNNPTRPPRERSKTMAGERQWAGRLKSQKTTLKPIVDGLKSQRLVEMAGSQDWEGL